MSAGIYLQEHTVEWADEFNQERTRIERALAGRLLAIEHVGSTSIQGMIAKPIIDIAVLVSSLKVIDETIKANLASLKYLPMLGWLSLPDDQPVNQKGVVALPSPLDRVDPG